MARRSLAQHGAHGFLPGASAQLLWPGAGTTFVSRELEELPPWIYTPREVSFPPDKIEVPGLAALDHPALVWVPAGQGFRASVVHQGQVAWGEPLRHSKHDLS